MLPEPIAVTLLVIDVLDALNIPYVLGGSWASARYGTARSTLDSDLIVQLSPQDVGPFIARLTGDFYADEFTAIYPETPVKLTNKDSLKAQWEGIYKKYDVQLVDRGEPTIIESEDMAISYNSFNEIFINKETRDTIKNVGTYIIAWKRQADDSWKIEFETLQNN